jgi:flavin reductase (DIM6/NTAB) family NADH-FMN oxidoreductase RutF
MDANAKKAALRMIPYGLYVLTAKAPDGTITAATVNWVTQCSFNPPLVAVAIKTDSHGYGAVKAAGHFVLNVLGKGQQKQAFGFFKPAQVDDGKISGEPFKLGSTGAPVLTGMPAAVECKVVGLVEKGDHHTFVGEVVDVHLPNAPSGRPDAATLELRDLGDNVFYGG